MICDSSGNLFGAGSHGGDYGYGTVFEIVKEGDAYISSPVTLASFDFSNGAWPESELVMDKNGNLFGTTSGGGENGNYGTVFEIKKLDEFYDKKITSLFSFDMRIGANPSGSLIVDASGDLFGTTSSEGGVFELKNNNGEYESSPSVLNYFHGTDGAGPVAQLVANAHGELFGTTNGGGSNNGGTVFKLVNSGFVVATGSNLTLGALA